MKAIPLEAQVRIVTGKKVKKLRKEGLLPVGVYGKDVKSTALAVALKDFMKVYGKAGETGLVELKYDGKAQQVLIKNVQIHPVTRLALHAELHAVNLKEKIKVNVPVELVGDSPAVLNNVGTLLQTLSEVEVEALPTELPEKLEVDVSGLSEVGQQVTVGELKAPAGVAILTPAEEVVVNVASAVSEEVQKELAAQEAAKAAVAAETDAEGAAPTEGGETPVKEETPEAKKETTS